MERKPYHKELEEKIAKLEKENDQLRKENNELSNYNLQQEESTISQEEVTQIEETIEYAQRQLGLIEGNLIDMIWISDLNGEIEYISPSVQRMLGYTPEEVKKITLTDILTEESHKLATAIVKEELAKEGEGGNHDRSRTVEVQQYRKDGNKVWAEATTSFLRDKKGVPNGIIGVTRDISARKEAEEALRNNKERFKLIAESTSDVFYEWNIATNELIWFGNIDAALGYLQGEFEHTLDAWLSQIHEKDRPSVEDAVKIHSESTQKNDQTYRIVCKDNTIRYLQDCSSPILDSDGKPIKRVGGISDITEQKNLAEKVIRSQKMDSIGTLVSGIAHDFNNILSGITLSLEQLYYDRSRLDKKSNANVKNALDASKRAADLVRNLQSLKGKKNTRKTTLDVHETAREVFCLLEETTDKIIEKRTYLESERFYINGNASELHQVFLNLAINGIKAIEERGAKDGDYIRINASDYRAVAGDNSSLAAGEYVHLTFEDNGRGMSEEVLRKAFDPFYTTRQAEGQGLGLAMVYNIVTERHGGQINIESVVGEGTTFHIYLPKKEPTKKTEPIRDNKSYVGDGENILVIDDEDMIRALVEKTLIRNGYRVIQARDGKEGLEKYSKDPDSVNLVLLDRTMPKMSGKDVFESLLGINPHVKVIISSGQTYDDTKEGPLGKAKAHLNKPYRISDILRTINTVLHED